MQNNRIPISALDRFIKTRLPKKLKQDLVQLHIIREADLASCVYYHLRNHLRGDRTWRVLVERRSGLTGHYVDVIAFREKIAAGEKRQVPRIAMELKWNWRRIAKKDRTSLGKCIELMGIEKVYFITTLTDEKGYQRTVKTKTEKFRLFEIVVRLGLKGPALDTWKTERNLFIKNMALGKRSNA